MNLNLVKALLIFCCIVFTTSFSVHATTNTTYLYQTNRNTFTHTIAKGETVYSIAKMYNLSPNDIYDINPNAFSGLKTGENLVIPKRSTSSKSSTTNQYSVKSKETLYSLSKQFGVTINDIIDANPSLATTPLHDGQIIQIPEAKNEKQTSLPTQTSNNRFIEHNVTSKETLYGIAKQYNVTPETLINYNPELKNGLKQNSKIIVPISDNAPQSNYSNNSQTDNTLFTSSSAINIGVILPILNKSEGQGARFLEYYEGFLLALNDMKAKGLSANVYVFDMGSETGTTKLKSLLETYELKSLDLIIGGVSPEQVNTISNFAQKEGIKYAIPFPTKTNVVLNSDQVFQVNGTHANLNIAVADAFASRFGDANVIYIKNSTGANDKNDFLSGLSTQLAKVGIKEKTVVADQNLTMNLTSAIDYRKKNIIIPASGSSAILQTLLPSLNQISNEKPNVNITLFGHTEWQTYPQFFSDFNKYDAYVYTPFYFVDEDSKTKQFVANYKKWYGNKSLINTYPRYGILGYDTGIYFLSALQKYGKNFDTSIGTNSVKTLQTPFFFVKTGPQGGYMNTGFYFVHYKLDGSIDKIEYSK